MKKSKVCYQRELIGEEAEVVAATNPGLVGIKGRVQDETKMTITIRDTGNHDAGEGTGKGYSAKIKRLLKPGLTLRLASGQLLDGQALLCRPEERIGNRRAR